MDSGFRFQMRAMISSLNAYRAVLVTVPELKSSFYYYGGKHNFARMLDTALEKFPRHVEVIYHRVPGSYTEVYIHVKQEIISNI